MAKGDMIKCRMCGTLSEQKGNKPREYCGPNCGNIYKYSQALSNAIHKANLEGQYRKDLKGELFIISNSF